MSMAQNIIPESLNYRAGYERAIKDIADIIRGPTYALNEALLHRDILPKVLEYYAEHVDEFMECPGLFEFEYEITSIKHGSGRYKRTGKHIKISRGGAK